MENSQNKKPNKYVVLTTYLIAVVCLLLGLFLPFFGGKGAEGILALQLPDAINQIAKKEVLKFGKEFALSYPIAIFGTKATLDVMACVALLYAVVTVFSLIALIPVGISTKKGTKTASVFAYIVEIAAVIVTTVYVLIALQYQVSKDLTLPAVLLPAVSNFSYSMLIALAGPLLMLIALSVLNKKGAGVLKMFLFLLSAIGVLALYDFSLIIPKLAKIKLAPALFGEAISGTGINTLHLLFEGGYKEALSFMSDAKGKAALVLCTISALVVIINYLIDIIRLSTGAESVKAKKTGIIFNVVRYGLALLAIFALFITVTICKYKIGIMIIALLAAVLILVLINVIKLIVVLKKAKKAEPEQVEDIGEVEEVEYNHPARPPYQRREPIYAEPAPRQVYEQPAPEAVYIEPERREPVNDKYGFNEPAPAPNANEPVQMDISDLEPQPEKKPVPLQSAPPVQANVNTTTTQETRIYTINTIYGGPVDDFMRKLTNEEKVEFAMTFIEKSKGNIGNIPDYVIGGNNRLFFSSAFIYLGRIRGLISDGLLNKMYKELNML